MPLEFRLPDIGEGVAEGEVTQWLVSEGDEVSEDQPLVEVMTDKATVEIPSPASGKVRKIVAQAGEVVPVGNVLVVLELPEGATAPRIASHGHGGGDGPSKAKAREDAGRKEKEAGEAAERRRREEEAEAEALYKAEEEARRRAEEERRPAAAKRPAGQRATATPYTRRLAREKGVDIETVEGTGPGGRVTEEDLARAARGERAPARAGKGVAIAAAAPRPAEAAGEDEVVPIRGLRKRIYERMAVSKGRAAHFSYVDDLDITELVEVRTLAKERARLQGAKLTYLPFIMKALVEGFRRFPTLNATVDDAAGTYTVRRSYNFGIAVDTDNGLIVPVVKDADRKSLIQLALEIERVAADARNGRSKLEDLQGGTFTITNAGNIGGLFATPIINYPEVAILGVHKIQKAPRVVDGRVAVRDVMYLSISIDHRINDGATGARFMNAVKELLEDPKRILVGEI